MAQLSIRVRVDLVRVDLYGVFCDQVTAVVARIHGDLLSVHLGEEQCRSVPMLWVAVQPRELHLPSSILT